MNVVIQCLLAFLVIGGGTLALIEISRRVYFEVSDDPRIKRRLAQLGQWLPHYHEDHEELMRQPPAEDLPEGF